MVRRAERHPAPTHRAKNARRGALSELFFEQAEGQARYTYGGSLMPPDRIEIPNRSLFRQPEVCEIAQVQAYVLRSWEAEFPDLGVAKTEGGPRVYRRADVERVLRIKHLLFVEGLTLAGVRRKLMEEGAGDARTEKDALRDVAALFGVDARERILQVKRGLRELASMLSRRPSTQQGGNGGVKLKQASARPAPAAKPAAPPQQHGKGKKKKKRK